MAFFPPHMDKIVKSIETVAEAVQVAAFAYAESVRKQPDQSGQNYTIQINIDSNYDEYDMEEMVADIAKATRLQDRRRM